MSSFEQDADRVLALIGEGLSQADACERTSVPMGTLRKWIAAGRRTPNSMYGEFVAKMEAARIVDEPKAGDAGPLEAEVEKLLVRRELKGEMSLIAAEALTLARSADRLGETKGAAAAIALTQVSRRLEELVERLQVPKADNVDRLQADVRAARARAAAVSRIARDGERDQ